MEFPTSGMKTGFNLLDDEDFTIPYIIDTTQNSPAGYQLPTQDNKNLRIIDINKEDPNKDQGELDKLQYHQTLSGKYKFNIRLFIRNRYHRTYLEDIHSIFDQFRPVVSHIEVFLPNKPPTPNNIGEGLKVIQRKLWK